MQRVLALLLSVGLAAPACVTVRATRMQTRGQVVAAGADNSVLADFARQLPVGTRVRATVAGNRTVRGTLLKTTDTSMFVQPRGRVAEPVVEVPLASLVSLEQDVERNGGSTGRAIAVGAAAGAGAAVGIILLLIAMLD